MTDYQKYINALRKCAKEHENDRTFTGHISVSDLCKDTANLLEVLKQQPCEDALSPTVEPVGLEEAKKLIYQEWKSKVAEDNPNQRLLVAYQIAMKALEQEPCEDAVSRQAVLDTLDKMDSVLDENRSIETYKELLNACYKDLPTVTPVYKKEWIPVSERLPKPFTYVNATCRSLVDDRENWVVETMYLPIPKENNEQGYSDWGNIPILNCGKAEVVAWMERNIPEPYNAESEDKE